MFIITKKTFQIYSSGNLMAHDGYIFDASMSTLYKLKGKQVGT